MNEHTDHELILRYLQRRPSVASAIAIGHYHVLNGAPTWIALEALGELCRMPCDWTVAVLDQAVTDSSRPLSVRRRALKIVHRLLLQAIERGYTAINQSEVDKNVRSVLQVMHDQRELHEPAATRFDGLCIHLGQAVTDGLLGEVPLE